MKTLLEKLKSNKTIPMHMPGHKRNTALAPYLKSLGADLDITEISGFDNLHNATGILKESMEKAAKLRNADVAFYLVNGTTGGILAAVSAVVGSGDKVIVARNCHKSVYNAIELADARPLFVLPKIDPNSGILGDIDALDIEKKIKENPDVKLVIVTSPNYEGVVSDIKKISEICKKSGVVLLVDAAHGSHFGYYGGFPKDAMACGADIVVESLHKTLPSLTQTAICYAKKEFAPMLQEKLAVFQTSSPSYLLMASLDGCISLIEEKGDEIFSLWQENLEKFYEKCEKLKNIKVLKECNGFFDHDISKIVLLCENGKWLFEELQKRGIECEMAAVSYVLAMTGPGDTEEMLSYFAASLLEIDKVAPSNTSFLKYESSLPEVKLSIKEAKKCETKVLDITDALGQVSAGYIWAYPPGIPLVVPGECIEKAEMEVLKSYMDAGIELFCSGNVDSGKILVIK